jgi:hypothetical protein
MLIYNFIFEFNIINNYNLYNLLNEIFLDYFFNSYIIIYYNKYKFVEYYYYIYINLYLFYKIIKKFILFMHFSMLKLYVIFINDSVFFNLNNILLIMQLKLRKFIKYNSKYYNKRFFKLNRKFKYYYRFGSIGYLRFIFFLVWFSLFILMWQNRTVYYKIYFFLYPIIFYVLVLNLCTIIVPFFYYKPIGILLVIFVSFMFFLLKVIN